MKNFNTNTSNLNEWLTPPEIVSSLGKFDLDPCSPIDPPWSLCEKSFNINDDGLSKSWSSYRRVWCNPPYGRETFKWLSKLSAHGNGIALIFARTETIGFHNEVWCKADSIFFFKGRLKFYKVDGTQGDSANAPSCLVCYGENNTGSIKKSGLTGKLIRL